MPGKRYSAEQIVNKLREADVAVPHRVHGNLRRDASAARLSNRIWTSPSGVESDRSLSTQVLPDLLLAGNPEGRE